MKQTVAFLFCISLIACQSKQPEIAEQSAPSNSLKHEAFIKNYFKTFNAHDWPQLANFYIENAEFKDPTLGQAIVKQSKDQTISKYTELAKIFPDVKDEVQNIYPSDSTHVIVEFISSGTGPDGIKFQLPICTIFTIENGLITKDFTYFDNFDEGEKK
jgi:hypothetical protein